MRVLVHIQVADFLQDDATVALATKHVRRHLLAGAQPQLRVQAAEESKILQTIPSHLMSQAISLGGSPATWLGRLPPCLHALALPAAVRHSSLQLRIFPGDPVQTILDHLPGLPRTVDQLSLGFTNAVGAGGGCLHLPSFPGSSWAL